MLCFVWFLKYATTGYEMLKITSNNYNINVEWNTTVEGVKTEKLLSENISLEYSSIPNKANEDTIVGNHPSQTKGIPGIPGILRIP